MWSNRQWNVSFCIRVKCFHPPWYLMFWSVIDLAQTGGRPLGTGPVPARTGRAAGLDEPHRGASRWAEEGGRGSQSHWDRACQAPCTTKVDHTSFNFMKQNKEAVDSWSFIPQWTFTLYILVLMCFRSIHSTSMAAFVSSGSPKWRVGSQGNSWDS